jgi:AcrR family transcriptional regulator
VAFSIDRLAARRPKRADGARNFDALLDAAAAVFAEDGQDAALEKIAARAGLGIGTLYRNFPTREDLVEATYIAEVHDLCRLEATLVDGDPWDELVTWVHAFVALMTSKSGLLRAIDRDSAARLDGREAIYGSMDRLLARAQKASLARRDLDTADAMAIFKAVAAVPVDSEAQRQRILGIALDAVRSGPRGGGLRRGARSARWRRPGDRGIGGGRLLGSQRVVGCLGSDRPDPRQCLHE